MGERMHRVIEVARLLGVSKVTVYKKMELNKKELKSYIRYRSNIAYIEDPGVEILRKALNLSADDDIHQESAAIAEIQSAAEMQEELNATQSMVLQSYDLHCSDLLQQLESYSHMIKVRKEENERKEQQLKMLQRLVKWNKSSVSFVEKMQDALIQIGE